MVEDFVWLDEGHVLDDAGNLIVTTYIDLREEGRRTPIPALVKGCRREHALEDGETILVSKPARFRQYGEALIRDVQEGLAKEEFVTVAEETADQAARQRAIADLNEAHELSGKGVGRVRSESHTAWNKQSKSLSYGNEWWIYCASIRPKGEDWDRWRATLPDDYDHVSEIGQPAKFAVALARMVTEQIAAHGSDARLRITADGGQVAETRHRFQWVVHGPVVYTDRVYEALTREGDDRTKLAAEIFTKKTKFADQREYRFAILNEGAGAETVRLDISGMMKDALNLTEGGLMRATATPAERGREKKKKRSPNETASGVLLQERQTVTDRRTQWEEWRTETRGPDGQIESSENERHEQVEERTVERIREPGGEGLRMAPRMRRNDGAATRNSPSPLVVKSPEKQDRESIDEEAMRELVKAEGDGDDGHAEDGAGGAIFYGPGGRGYSSIEEMINDPAGPESISSRTWQESACTPEEAADSFGAVAILAFKVTKVTVENRLAAASASWHAVQCIRNIYARLGDIVDSLAIERERFVVIRLRRSERVDASGRIVITSSGSYSYRFTLPDTEAFGSGEVALGVMFFPMDHDVEVFERFGWPGKRNDPNFVDGHAECDG